MDRLARAHEAVLALGVALADRDHCWSTRERSAWEKAERNLRQLLEAATAQEVMG